jgi:hypothetical protein
MSKREHPDGKPTRIGIPSLRPLITDVGKHSAVSPPSMV